MPTIELWLFTVTDPQTGKRRRTTYRLTMEEARARYVDPEPVPNSVEVREVGEQRGYGSARRPRREGEAREEKPRRWPRQPARSAEGTQQRCCWAVRFQR